MYGKTFFILFSLLIMLSSCGGQKHNQNVSTNLEPFKKINLPGVQGRIDHIAISADGKKMYLAALANNTVEIIDLVKGTKDTVIRDLQAPQAVLLSPETKKILISNGGDGKCNFCYAKTLKQSVTIDIGDDADNIRYDSALHIAYVGYGNGGIAIMDMDYSRQIGSIPLSAHPEGFELDKTRNRIYANVPQSADIEVIDLGTQKVIETWKLRNVKGNFPMAYDESHHRIFIATRYPAKLIVYDVLTGSEINSYNCSSDADEIGYDPSANHLYVTCGAGYIDDFKEDPATGSFILFQKIRTRKGARTSLYLPAPSRTLYLAVPQEGDKDNTEIWIYHL